ncbi:cytidine deaminase [Acidithiobacillus ferrivorans]|uniref:Cytidine deaminase n=1 Tax=Acidithiobacillus ferrivorans TaxID=160808 RepID=A0A7T5BGD1_9PROT|nr:cytidine deaminase [Acidithiobacillus ferrivorans]QQD72206.1 cytidine deaminase [Acidithiobacillus ferrivorans]
MNCPLIAAEISEATLAQLRKAAEAMLKHAYAPYSHFPVGAALLTGSGRIFQGCNIENAAYPSGLCAEAVALGQMIATLGPMPIRAAYIACKGHSPAWPCGSCRQRLNEFASPTMWVYTATLAGSPQRMAFSDLLPNSFGAADLQGCGQ